MILEKKFTLIQSMTCHTLSSYHQVFVDRDPRGVYLVVRDYYAYPIRLQAYRPYFTVNYGGQDIIMT